MYCRYRTLLYFGIVLLSSLSSMTEYFKIGKLVSAFGVKGELILKHTLGKKTALKGLQALFIEERKQSFIPWFILQARIKSADELYLQLADVTTREAAIKLVQKEVWLPDVDFKKFSAKIITCQPARLCHYRKWKNGGNHCRSD